MTKQEKIAKKVRNLLAIAEDDAASTGEIQNAMNHAHRLMGEYHLSEDDLAHEPQDDYSKVDKSEFTRRRSYIGKKSFAWENSLAHFVSEFVGIPFYITRKPVVAKRNGILLLDEKGNIRKGKAFVFYGVAEDSAIACELFDELRLLISTMAVAKYASVYKGEGAVYSQGFVSGLNSQLKETAKLEHQETTSTALVLVHRREDLIKYKKEKARNYLIRKCGIRLVTGTGLRGGSGSSAAYSDGKTDGAKATASADRSRKIC